MSKSTVVYDALVDDPSINGQEWCCLSFVSPENLIERRELFYMNCFLYEEVNKYIGSSAEHMAKTLSTQYNKIFESMIETYSKSDDPKDKEFSEKLKILQSEN